MNRDSTIFYRSFYEAIKELPEANQLEIYNAIFEHSLNMVKPKLSGLSKTIYTLIEPQIEANLKRFIDGKKGAEHGKLGGRPPKEKPQRNPTAVFENNPNETPNNNNNNNDNNNEKNNPSLKKKQTPKHLFSESIYINKHKFKEVLSDWNSDKLKYYYEALITWSNEGNKKIDWIATAKQWASRDEREGRVKFTDIQKLPDWRSGKVTLTHQQYMTLTEPQKRDYNQIIMGI